MFKKEEKQSELFSLPTETSWHFERILKPDDKKIDNYVLIQPGAPDISKVLRAYFHHPMPGYNIASIEIVYNELLNRMFFNNLKLMNARTGNPKYIPTWPTQSSNAEKCWRESTYAQLKQLSEKYNDFEMPNMLIMPMWHGTSDTAAEHIFKEGYGIFTGHDPKFVTDDGYFGKGIYTAHEAEYSFRSYAKKHGDQAVLLLNWNTVFSAYPVIDGDMPKLQGEKRGYDNCDSHFIPVRSDHHPNTDVYYPCKPSEMSQYHELVVFDSAQCLPRYRIKLLESIPQAGIEEIALLSYQTALDFLGLHQYENAIQSFKEAHEANHPAAGIRLHWLHTGAAGIIPSNPEKLSTYETISPSIIDCLKKKATFRGDNEGESQFVLGWCYQQGLGVNKDLAKAAKYYWIAANQGHRDAQYQLGLCCASGMGVKSDMKLALVYYEQAAAQGHVHAHYVLSYCYELGCGTPTNPMKALAHKEAAQKGKHPQLSEKNKMLTSKCFENEQLKKELAESKEREKSLKKELEEYKSTVPSPIPKLQPQPKPLSLFFSPPATSASGLNTQQQKRQNELVSVCLKGDLILVKQFESQEASFFHPNGEGLYPLVAAVYSTNWELVEYIENKLQEAADEQWVQVDSEKAIALLDSQKPKPLNENSTYQMRAFWYAEHQKKSWCNVYDRYILTEERCDSWHQENWAARCDQILSRGSVPPQSLKVNIGGKDHLYLPCLNIHRQAENKIEEKLEEMKCEVLNKIKTDKLTLSY